ncbi:hypothetical protein SDC9_101543 [bioreactor metagenome]|jgi:hypothetical protein|uniref:Uncharacterized protein n=1 Tax=bioreactor metagenome TaxID=1076179 RepID=A0A645AV35_9ZZZZ
MGALTKNKVTRVEQGKRRAANKASVKKDPKVQAVPLHKQGLISSIFKTLKID